MPTFLIFFSIQSFAVTITSTSSTDAFDTRYITLYVTLDNIEKFTRVKCVIYNKKGVAVGKGTDYVDGIGKVQVTVARNSGAHKYECKDIGAY